MLYRFSNRMSGWNGAISSGALTTCDTVKPYSKDGQQRADSGPANLDRRQTADFLRDGMRGNSL